MSHDHLKIRQSKSGKVVETQSAQLDNWDLTKTQFDSDTHLEDDTGHGGAAIIRQFVFKANPQTFKYNPPTKQDLFNHHLKQVEILLWNDGMKIMTNVSPQLTFNKKKTSYTIIVGAIPMRGQILPHGMTPKLLKEIV